MSSNHLPRAVAEARVRAATLRAAADERAADAAAVSVLRHEAVAAADVLERLVALHEPIMGRTGGR